MKKSIVFLFTLLFMVCAYAQNFEHMKFMGIPMGISINSFHKNILAKGMKYELKDTEILGNGTARIYSGIFAGYKADCYVYFNHNSKKVYRAKAVISKDELQQAENVYSDLYHMLNSKYDNATQWDLDEEIKGKVFSISTGRIECYIHKFTNPFRYAIFIDYYDLIESFFNDKDRQEDL